MQILKSFHLKSFRRLIFALIVLLIFPPLIISEAYIYYSNRNHILADSRKALVDAADRESELMQNWLENMSSNLKIASTSEHLKGNFSDRIKFLKNLNENISDEIQCVHLTNVQSGIIEASSCEKRIGKNPREEKLSWFGPGSAGKQYISSAFPGKLDGKPIFVITYPVFNGGKQTHILSFHPSLWRKTQSLFKPTPSGYTMLFDEGWRFLVYPDVKYILKTTVSDNSFPTELQTFIQSSSEKLVSFGEANIHGERYLVSAKKILIEPNRFWTVAVVSPVRESHSYLISLERVLFIMLLAEMALMVFIVLLLSRKFALPVEDLSNIMQKISEGEFNLRNKKKYDIEEFDHVFSIFNSMLDKLNTYLIVIGTSSDAIIVTDPDWKIIQVNRSFEKISGLSEMEVSGADARNYILDQENIQRISEIENELKNTGKWYGEFWNTFTDKEKFYEKININRIEDVETGKLINYIIVISDSTDIKEASQNLEYMAQHDFLTGIPNRFLFYNRMEHVIKRSQRKKNQAALFYIDIDNFKLINDTLGHDAGDQLLIAIAKRLKQVLRDEDTLARIGGDEFSIILEDVENVEETLTVATRILEEFKDPFILQGAKYYITISIGISLYPDDGENVSDLAKDADTAMYHAKKNGKNQFQYYTEELNIQVQRRLKMENDLREAIHNKNFQVFYQPIVDEKTNRIKGLEALMRWEQKKDQFILPSEFIDILEETGLIIEAGKFVIFEAVVALKMLKVIDPRMYVSLNLSPIQLYEPGIEDLIIDLIHEERVSPENLVLEITETTMMKNRDRILVILKKLYQAGIRIAIDDFGVGYSSMSYLKDFPVHIMKIDKKFVDDLELKPDSVKIIKAISALGKSLDLDIIVEGVETEAQKNILKTISGFNYQGFYFYKPMPFLQIREILKSIELGDVK